MSKDNLVFLVLALVLILGGGYFLTAAGFVSIKAAGGVIAAALVFFALYFILEGSFASGDVKKRYEKLEASSKKARDSGERGKDAAQLKRKVEELYDNRKGPIDALSKQIQKIFKIQGSRLSDLRMHLQSAGYFRERALAIYLVATAVAPIVGMLLGGLYAQANGSAQEMFLVWMIIGAGAGFMGVRFYISKRIKERQKAVYSDLPDAVDLLVIYLQSGITVDTALGKISHVFQKRQMVTAQELHILTRELGILPDRIKAYENFRRRIDTSLVNTFCSIVIQSEATGAPIISSLQELARNNRRERLLEAKRKAAKIPILMQIPIVLFILPSLFLTVMGSTAVQIMNSFSGGG